jgi:hypothetical protein
MPTLITRLLLFVSSYFPLTCIFAILYFRQHRVFAMSMFLVGTGALVALLVFLRLARRFSGLRIQAAEVRREDGEAMSYLVTYVVPFLALPSDNWEHGAALAVFFVVLGVLYVNSNMIHVNPSLNVFGFRLYEITTDDGDAHALISRRRLRRSQSLEVTRLGDDLFLEK